MNNYRTRVNRVALFCVLLTAAVLAYGAEWSPAGEGWEYVRQVGDIELYRKSVAGSVFPALLVRRKIQAPASEVHEVVTDYNRFAEFVPYAMESMIVQASGSEANVYQRLHLPGPVADRHYVIRSEGRVVRESEPVFHVSWTLNEERTRALDMDRVIAPEVFEGFWRVTDIVPGDECDAVYSIHIEPGGKVPAWLYRRVAERYVVKLMNAVTERAKHH